MASYFFKWCQAQKIWRVSHTGHTAETSSPLVVELVVAQLQDVSCRWSSWFVAVSVRSRSFLGKPQYLLKNGIQATSVFLSQTWNTWGTVSTRSELQHRAWSKFGCRKNIWSERCESSSTKSWPPEENYLIAALAITKNSHHQKCIKNSNITSSWSLTCLLPPHSCPPSGKTKNSTAKGCTFRPNLQKSGKRSFVIGLMKLIAHQHESSIFTI